MISPARSRTAMCCITVHRSRDLSNRLHNSPVVRGAFLSRSRICRRGKSANALKTKSSSRLSGVLDMLYFYNISCLQSQSEANPMEPKFQVQLKIRKPPAKVFEAVVNPKDLSGYFVQAASGPLVEGATVKWKFAEVPGEHDVLVRHVVKDKRIVFEWPAEGGRYNTRVEMIFKQLDGENTLVQISESGWGKDPAGIETSYGNAGGLVHMMCCLKAYIEVWVKLRAGGGFFRVGAAPFGKPPGLFSNQLKN